MTELDQERERFLTKIGQIAPKPKAEPTATKKLTKKDKEQPNGDRIEQ
jgi:hypothetical protein